MRQEHQVESLNNCIRELQQQAYAQRLELQDAQHGYIESRREQVRLQEELSMKEKVLPETQICARFAGSSSARVHRHWISWTLAAHVAEELAYPDIEYEFFDYGGGSWVRRWLPSWGRFAYWLIAPDGGWHGAFTQVQWMMLVVAPFGAVKGGPD